jgi:hypothetical protein
MDFTCSQNGYCKIFCLLAYNIYLVGKGNISAWKENKGSILGSRLQSRFLAGNRPKVSKSHR